MSHEKRSDVSPEIQEALRKGREVDEYWNRRMPKRIKQLDALLEGEAVPPFPDEDVTGQIPIDVEAFRHVKKA